MVLYILPAIKEIQLPAAIRFLDLLLIKDYSYVAELTDSPTLKSKNPAPSSGWGPRGQRPSKNRQGPGKNNWTHHVPSGLPDKNFGILGIFGIKKSKKTMRVFIHDSFPLTHGHF